MGETAEGIVVSAAAQEAGDDGKGSWEISELSVFETYELGPIVFFVKNTRPFECSFITSRFQNSDRFRKPVSIQDFCLPVQTYLVFNLIAHR